MGLSVCLGSLCCGGRLEGRREGCVCLRWRRLVLKSTSLGLGLDLGLWAVVGGAEG